MYRSPRRAAALLAGMGLLSFSPLAAKDYTIEDIRYALTCYPAVVIAPLNVDEPFYPAAGGHDPADLEKGPKIVLKRKKNGRYVVKIKEMITPIEDIDPAGSKKAPELNGSFYAFWESGALQPEVTALLSSPKEVGQRREPYPEKDFNRFADYLSRSITTNTRLTIDPNGLPHETYLFLRTSSGILIIAADRFSYDRERVTVFEEWCAVSLEK